MRNILGRTHAADRYRGEVRVDSARGHVRVPLDRDEPGATALTVMPNGASSRAQLRVRPIRAFFATAYADRPGGGRSATSESTWMMRPN